MDEKITTQRLFIFITAPVELFIKFFFPFSLQKIILGDLWLHRDIRAETGEMQNDRMLRKALLDEWHALTKSVFCLLRREEEVCVCVGG